MSPLCVGVVAGLGAYIGCRAAIWTHTRRKP